MRVLVSSTAGAGHFAPLVPFAAACRRAGHDVLVAAPESFEKSVVASGFDFWPFADAPAAEWGAVISRLPFLSADEAEVVMVGEVFAGIGARAALPRLLAALDEWRPDVVVRENAEYASTVAAEHRGVPQVRVGVGLGILEDQWTPVAAPALTALRASVGLPDDPTGETMAASPYLSLLPASFEDPDAPGPPGTRRYRNPRVAGWTAAPLPPWWGDDARPLVYATFGSVAAALPQFAPVYRAAVEALADLPVRALLTVGAHGGQLDLGTVPTHVHVERWVTQDDVLAATTAVVSHGGSGTVLGSLVTGVPQVVVPLFADQPGNARRVAALGAGVGLERGIPEPGVLAAAVSAVLATPSYGADAAAVAREIEALPPTDEAVDFLASLTAG